MKRKKVTGSEEGKEKDGQNFSIFFLSQSPPITNNLHAHTSESQRMSHKLLLYHLLTRSLAQSNKGNLNRTSFLFQFGYVFTNQNIFHTDISL
jgi:uncharacterized membrane protein